MGTTHHFGTSLGGAVRGLDSPKFCSGSKGARRTGGNGRHILQERANAPSGRAD